MGKGQLEALSVFPDAKFIYTGCDFINEKDEKIGKRFNIPEKPDYSFMLKRNVITCSSVLLDKKVYKQSELFFKHIKQ